MQPLAAIEDCVCVFVSESRMKWREVPPWELTSFFSPFIFLHVQTSVSKKVNPDSIICICDEHMYLKELQADRGKLHTQSFFVNYTHTHTLFCVSTGLICMQINLRWAPTEAELFSHVLLWAEWSHTGSIALHFKIIKQLIKQGQSDDTHYVHTDLFLQAHFQAYNYCCYWVEDFRITTL